MWCSYGGHDVDDKCKAMIDKYGEYGCEKYCPYSNTPYWDDDELINTTNNISLYVFIGLFIIILLYLLR